MDFQIVLAGLNHRTAAVSVRERFALAEHSLPETWALPKIGSVRESLILSTCNRVEVLGVGGEGLTDNLLAQWSKACGQPLDALQPYLYIHKNMDAVRHVFEVASSLDSMVLGEPQILGQMKDAYRKAVNAHATGPILNTLMHKAFSVAKRVRSETAVAASAVSISYAAVELAKRIFGSMPGQKAMLVGAGEMAELAAMHLLQAGIDEIIVLNRTFSHAQELAARFNGRALPFSDMLTALQNVDIIITSTGSREPILHAAEIKKALKARKNRPMFFIDIAVPRDIEPEVNSLDNVYLYDIDDLKEVVEENLANRREEAARASLIIDEEVTALAHWFENLEVTPTIQEIVNRGEAAARMELAKTFKRLGTLDDESRAAIETMALSLVHKLNHEPIMYLKSNGMGNSRPLDRIHTIRRVFNLDQQKHSNGK